MLSICSQSSLYLFSKLRKERETASHLILYWLHCDYSFFNLIKYISYIASLLLTSYSFLFICYDKAYCFLTNSASSKANWDMVSYCYWILFLNSLIFNESDSISSFLDNNCCWKWLIFYADSSNFSRYPLPKSLMLLKRISFSSL